MNHSGPFEPITAQTLTSALTDAAIYPLIACFRHVTVKFSRVTFKVCAGVTKSGI